MWVGTFWMSELLCYDTPCRCSDSFTLIKTKHSNFKTAKKWTTPGCLWNFTLSESLSIEFNSRHFIFHVKLWGMHQCKFFFLPVDQITHLDCLPVCSGRGWCTHPSVWSQRGTRSTPGPSARGATAGRANATPDSKWHAADLSYGTPAAVRPGSGGLSHSYWADPGSWGPSPAPPWPPSSFSVS